MQIHFSILVMPLKWSENFADFKRVTNSSRMKRISCFDSATHSAFAFCSLTSFVEIVSCEKFHFVKSLDTHSMH